MSASPGSAPQEHEPAANRDARYAAWFHTLDAWTEYWDIYHPETRGRYYFGDGNEERGLLTEFLPQRGRPPAFSAWTRSALARDDPSAAASFFAEARVPAVAVAVLQVDDLVSRLFREHFGSAESREVRADYLAAIHLFATDALPPATERLGRIPPNDHRRRTAGRHTLDGDVMWFAWALHLEAADALRGTDRDHARRALMMAGIATGCAANFANGGHRRTRSEYAPDQESWPLLAKRGAEWATDFSAAAREVRALYRIREWGAE